MPVLNSIKQGQILRAPATPYLPNICWAPPPLPAWVLCREATVVCFPNFFRLSVVCRHIEKRYQITTFNCWQTDWKKVPNFDFQLLADMLKKGTQFRLSIACRHIEKRYQISTFNFWQTYWKKVPNFDFQLLVDTLKRGTKFRLSLVGIRVQTTHVISLTRNQKVPFSTERVFLINIEKRHHYLVSYQ